MEFRIAREDCLLFCRKEGEGPLLLLIHGVACDSDYFQDTIAVLSLHFTVVSYDRRGYSRSTLVEKAERGHADFSVAVQTEDAAFLIEQQQMGPAFVAGCSAGGIIAVSLAETYPFLVRGLFLHEPPLAGDEKMRRCIDDWFQKLCAAAEKKRMNKALLLLLQAMGGMEKTSKQKSLEAITQDLKNLERFVYDEMEDFLHYPLKKGNFCIAALNPVDTGKTAGKSGQVPCVIAAGACDTEGLFACAAKSAAEYLNLPLLLAPGYHNLPADLPYEFAMLVLDSIRHM